MFMETMLNGIIYCQLKPSQIRDVLLKLWHQKRQSVSDCEEPLIQKTLSKQAEFTQTPLRKILYNIEFY